MRDFTERQWQTIENALRVAAERFDENAKVCAEHPRLVEQFETQARDSRELAARISDGE